MIKFKELKTGKTTSYIEYLKKCREEGKAAKEYESWTQPNEYKYIDFGSYPKLKLKTDPRVYDAYQLELLHDYIVDAHPLLASYFPKAGDWLQSFKEFNKRYEKDVVVDWRKVREFEWKRIGETVEKEQRKDRMWDKAKLVLAVIFVAVMSMGLPVVFAI